MEQMLPSAMVPGLVTVKKKDGTLQNVWPIDAKELITAGDATLVENGSVEAARLNANPLRSSSAPTDTTLVIAEVTGIAGAVVVAADEKTAQAAISAGDNADAQAADSDNGAASTENKSKAPTAAPAKTDTSKAN